MRERRHRARLGPLLVLAAACSGGGPPAHPLTEDELAVRERLGVPVDAQRVVIFAQTSHLDLDWQRTFADYYDSFVGDIFIKARQILDQQPRAYYGIAEMAFLEHHLEVHPEELAPLRAAADRGALRIVGGGMTSPDTLLPETELLFRDFQHGITFAEDVLHARPRAAWLPDSFGHSGTLPDILAAAGYDSVAFSRIDGASTLFFQLFDPEPLKPGSTAAELFAQGSAAFRWRGPGGATVLAHFMAGNGFYCQGDTIDYDENIQNPGVHTSEYRGDEPAYVDFRIDSYLAELEPYRRTPYLFVPVGCDFQFPKEQLIAYLDGYNQRHYPDTGVWAVAAPFDDYAQLMASWIDVLPTVEGELSPYFMGFYGSRAAVKRTARSAARPFLVAEQLATALGAAGLALVQSAAPALRRLTYTDHHDFVTGTASDAVVADEQLPLTAAAEQAGRAELAAVTAAVAERIPVSAGAVDRALAFNPAGTPRTEVAELVLPLDAGAVPAVHAEAGGVALPMELVAAPAPEDTTASFRIALADLAPSGWRVVDLLPGAAPVPPAQVTLDLLDGDGQPATGDAIERVVLANGTVRAQWDRAGGGFAMTSLTIDGDEALAGPSMQVRDYADDGGLWRLGHEMPGCSFTEGPPPADAETVQVLASSSLLVRVAFVSAGLTREASLAAGATGLDLAVITGAAARTTRTTSFTFAAADDARLRTSSPAGWLERPLERIYSPTFWPAVAWAEVGGWAVLLRQSTGVRMSTAGQVELMAVRNTRIERCDLLGGSGSELDSHRIEWRIERAATVADAERAAQRFNRPVELAVVGTTTVAAPDLPAEHSLVAVEGDGVLSALKPAERGDGIIVRVLLMPGPATVRLPAELVGLRITAVDLAERDGAELGIAGETVALDAAELGSIVGLRLH